MPLHKSTCSTYLIFTMIPYGHIRCHKLLGGATALAAASMTIWCMYLYFWPELRPKNKLSATIVAKTRDSPSGAYPPDIFPGGRYVETPYGIIKVFEWGPLGGEKVVLVHGIGTPCVALGNMARRFVSRGCRVMLFDLFGRGYSDSPGDLPHDDRLYTTQLLLVLASSNISWTGNSAFHLVGYSLGGGLVASFAAFFPHLPRTMTLVCPAGLIRSVHVDWKSRLIYHMGLIPLWLQNYLVQSRLKPHRNGLSADIPVEGEYHHKFNATCLSHDTGFTVGDVMSWQLVANDGLTSAYISSLRLCPIYNQHDGVWKRLANILYERRSKSPILAPPGLIGGKVCLILARSDQVIIADELVEDSRRVLGEDGVDIHVLPGGHEIAISNGSEVADLAINTWTKLCASALNHQVVRLESN